eukprot:1159981-Pelagomonas_calceolata.AAC.2
MPNVHPPDTPNKFTHHTKGWKFGLLEHRYMSASGCFKRTVNKSTKVNISSSKRDIDPEQQKFLKQGFN